MRIAVRLALASLPVCIGASPASRDHDRAALIADERAWGQAFVTGDAATVERLLSNDFRGYEIDGSAYDKADTIAFVRALPHGQSDKVDRFNIRFLGVAAVVQAHEWVKGPPPEKYAKERVFTDVWVRRGAGWRIVAAHDTLVDPGKH